MDRHPEAFRWTDSIYLCALDSALVDDNYIGWLNDPDISGCIVSGNFPQNRESVTRFVDSMSTPTSVSFAICLQENRRHIGNTALRCIDWVNRRAELGILLGAKDAHGKGYATESLQLVMEYAFKTLKLARLWTGTTNPKAVNLFARSGWKHEGTLRQHSLVGGEWKDNILLGILAEEFTL
jgi:[ribosomal protein S5]-alanine N-acetyltransferase